MTFQSSSSLSAETKVYQGGLIDGLLSTVAAVVPVNPAALSNGALTVDEILSRVSRTDLQLRVARNQPPTKALKVAVVLILALLSLSATHADYLTRLHLLAGTPYLTMTCSRYIGRSHDVGGAHCGGAAGMWARLQRSDGAGRSVRLALPA